MELVKAEFRDVKLGEVFYDPELSIRMQKIDEPFMRSNEIVNKHNNGHNAMGDGQIKNFKPTDTIKRATFRSEDK